MSSSEDDLRREQARARLAARQARRNSATSPQDATPPQDKEPPSDQRVHVGKANDARRNPNRASFDAPTAKQPIKTRTPSTLSSPLGRPLGTSLGKQLGKPINRGSYHSAWNSKKKSSSLVKRLALIALLLLLVFGLFTLGKSCVGKITEIIDEATQEEIVPADPESLPDLFEISAIIGDELALQMVVKSVTNPDLAWIATHVSDYEQYGSAIQRKLLRLAAMDFWATEFVRGYPESYPASSGQSGVPEYTGDGVPLYYQFDVRWAYADYGGEGIGLSGCAPTALAMVYQHVTGNTDRSPYDMAMYARDGGYLNAAEGTYTSLFTEGVSSLGLYTHNLDITSDSITWTLQNNGVIVANVKEGDFTEGGHYIVLTGIDEDGMISVNDPFSSVNSAKTWSMDTILSQSVNLYGYFKS